MKNDLLSPRDAGRLLGVTSWRVIQLSREGTLPTQRDSAGRRFFLRDDVERLAQQREAQRASALAAGARR